MRTAPLLAACLLLLLPPSTLRAQAGASLSGRVVDAETQQPLAGAHVFIAASLLGTTTDPDGRYRLEGVPAGAHRLYVSMLGYESGAQELRLAGDEALRFDFRLAPAVIVGPEVTVTARRDRRWPRRLRQFERLFLGETRNADSTRILNPGVLDFEGGLGRLVARASAPLEIENRALGYRIRYFLEEFESTGTRLRYDGEPLFEELAPADSAEAARWNAGRRAAFAGSMRHFLLAVLAGRSEEEGFLTDIRPSAGRDEWSSERYPFPASRLLSKRPDTTAWELDFVGVVEVTFLNEREDEFYRRWVGVHHPGPGRAQSSFMRLQDGPTLVDRSGEVLDPYGVIVYGYFAFERVADQLPKEYRPDG